MGATHQTGSEPAGRVAGSDSQSQRLTPCVSPLGSDVTGLACPSGREKWRPPTAPVMRAGIAPASGFAQTVLRLCSVTEPYIRCVSLSTPPHQSLPIPHHRLNHLAHVWVSFGATPLAQHLPHGRSLLPPDADHPHHSLPLPKHLTHFPVACSYSWRIASTSVTRMRATWRPCAAL